MRAIAISEYIAVSGGATDNFAPQHIVHDGGVQSVTITASYADVWAARDEFSSAINAGIALTAAASFGSGLIVTGACTLAAAVIAPELVPAAVKPCAALGTLAAGATSAYVGYQATKFVHANY